MTPAPHCPLCGGTGPFRPLADRWGRHHWLCPGCSLVFTDRAELPDPDRARARYALHRNGPGGLLVVMTSLWTDLDAFPAWSYANDFTHVAFHHDATLDWIARRHNLLRLPSPDSRVFLFRAPPAV